MQGYEHIDRSWIEKCASCLLPVFQDEISSFPGKVVHYYENRLHHLSVPDRIFFHLVESRDSQFPFAFVATYSESSDGKITHQPLKIALDRYGQEQKKLVSLLASIAKIEKDSAFIASLLETGELFHPILLSVKEAYTFLREIPLYESCGVKCRIPNWWKTKKNSFSVSLRISNKDSLLSADSLLSLSPKLSLGEDELTREDILSFLEISQGLHFLKNRWVEVDHEKLNDLLRRYDEANDRYRDRDLTIPDLVKVSLEQTDEDHGIDNLSFVRELSERIREFTVTESTQLPASFRGTLRPYQEDGRRWLHSMDRLSLGICLADDMGLGKTIQLLAYLDERRQKTSKYLLILPTSLIGNWEREIKTFAPEIPYSVYHGLNREISDFLTITTYGTVRADVALRDVCWDGIILDEAQAIKNPGTKQSKAVKALSGNMRIAMTGTPVENDLGDLYSLFDFLNPGLLGTPKEFESLVKSLSAEGSYGRLRTMISPFLLRRLKTDKDIISDLPEKFEISEYVDLSVKQAAIYRKVIRDFKEEIEKLDGINRRGHILTVLKNLKQILNHPSHYSGDNAYRPADSGKFIRLRELCEVIAEQHERVLIFTQYRELTEPLASFLETVFRSPGLVLHGGTSARERSRLVEQFNAADIYVPFMVLSLKAGGVGLNLTAANHVIHFDRWWNPAVENQATDRAFRIGQKKDVFVRKFISRGSVEEKIDELIASKSELAGAIIQENKAPAITELSNEEILKVFSLT
jgi:SNF2 family DNA or RNA helicase